MPFIKYFKTQHSCTRVCFDDIPVWKANECLVVERTCFADRVSGNHSLSLFNSAVHLVKLRLPLELRFSFIQESLLWDEGPE